MFAPQVMPALAYDRKAGLKMRRRYAAGKLLH
jgi:hypothetical protein